MLNRSPHHNIIKFKSRSLDYSEAFGSKISSENIPGTPMEPDEYGAPPLADHASYTGSVSDQMALISEISEVRRSSLNDRTQPPTPQPENNLNSNSKNHDLPNDVAKLSMIHDSNHQSHNSLSTVCTSNKRPSLAPSDVESSRRESKQDKSV